MCPSSHNTHPVDLASRPRARRKIKDHYYRRAMIDPRATKSMINFGSVVQARCAVQGHGCMYSVPFDIELLNYPAGTRVGMHTSDVDLPLTSSLLFFPTAPAHGY